MAFRVMSGTTAPSFGYMVTHGATTIWERWEADDNNNIMNSYNQPMLTQAGIWFYKYLGGIRQYIISEFGYDLSRTCDQIRPSYHHVETCQQTVPEAITAFLEGNSFEDVIRTAVNTARDI